MVSTTQWMACSIAATVGAMSLDRQTSHNPFQIVRFLKLILTEQL
jgi:hypothetical protein